MTWRSWMRGMRRFLVALAVLVPVAAHGQDVPQNAVSVTAQPREAARRCGATKTAILDLLGERARSKSEAGNLDRAFVGLLDGSIRAVVHLSGNSGGAACRYTVRLVAADGSAPPASSGAGLYERFAGPACDLVARREAATSETAHHIALDIEDVLARCFSLVVR